MDDPEQTADESADVIDPIEAMSEAPQSEVQEQSMKGEPEPPEGPDGTGGDAPSDKPPAAPERKAHTGWGANDQKTVDDSLDFATYVSVLSDFLTDERTKPPLTVSIEGQWGTGKSSFMAMLRDELEAENEDREPDQPGEANGASDETGADEAENGGEAPSSPQATDRTSGASPRYYTVEFNPWRHEQEDALWAAFMLEFFDQITNDLHVDDRWLGHLRLTWYRLKWRHGWRDLLRLGLVVPLVALALLFPPIARGLGVPLNDAGLLLGQGASVLALGVWTWQNVANPIETELQQYIADPDYENRVSFIEQFHEDFADILDAYVGDEAQVFVFIDDLDRCLPQKAAELVQSINLMISSGDPRVFFVIGMDRQKVAAGLAAKHRELLEYLRASDRRYPSTASGEAAAEREGIDGDGGEAQQPIEVYGLKFADNYLEKFVQIPFLIPKPRADGIGNLIREMAGTSETVGPDDLEGPLAVVELLLTATHYNENSALGVDDLPARIRAVYSTDGTVQRPLQVTAAEAQAAAGEEEWWAVLDDLAFTELDDEDEPLVLVDPNDAADWFRERAGEELIETNRTLASAIGLTDDGGDTAPVEESEVLPTERIVRIGQAVAPALDYNPRSVKTFVNLFRLRTMLASELGLFDDGTLTPEQLAKFVAIGLRWPPVSTKLREPDVTRALNEFAAGDREQPPDAIGNLNAEEQTKLTELLMWGVEDGDEQRRAQYRLSAVPEELFWISPRIDQPAHTPDEAVSAGDADRSLAT